MHLRLYVGDFAPGELVLVQRDARLFQVAQKAQLFGPQNQQCLSDPAFTSRCTTHSVDVLLKNLTLLLAHI